MEKTARFDCHPDLPTRFPDLARIQQNGAMTQPAMISLDESTYHRCLMHTPGIALVLFSSPACGTCRIVEQRLPRAAPEGVSLFRVDVQQATALARAFDIFHLPALLLYQDGHFHARLESEISVQALAVALDRALASPAQEEP